jgi:F420-non-reducing hydrogenase iron-sulfur subunit
MNNEALKIYIFYCSNSLEVSELSRCRDELKDYNLKVISLPCSGKIDIPYLVKAFETGADGVVIVTCELGQCRHVEGNMRAEKRAEAVDSLLEEVGAGAGRIVAIHIKEGQIEQTIEKIKNFCSRINKLKPGPALHQSGTGLAAQGI